MSLDSRFYNWTGVSLLLTFLQIALAHGFPCASTPPSPVQTWLEAHGAFVSQASLVMPSEPTTETQNWQSPIVAGVTFPPTFSSCERTADERLP